MKKLITLFVLAIMLAGCGGVKPDTESAWYDGFYAFCIRAPSQAGVAHAVPMYYESECQDMLSQAKEVDLYHTHK